MKKILPFIVITISLTLIYSCAFKKPKIYAKDTLEDVKIGKQIWSNKNLNVVQFSNGDSLFHAKSYNEWYEACKNKIPAWCNIKKDSFDSNISGKLYNWFAINDKRNLAPEGWRISTDKDWKVLIKFLGGSEVAGVKLKSNKGWLLHNNLNNIGFNAFPLGIRGFDAGFYYGNDKAYFWSPMKGKYPYCIKVILPDNSEIFSEIYHSGLGVSVRCVKN